MRLCDSNYVYEEAILKKISEINANQNQVVVYLALSIAN